jgi:hypothetical protein
MKKKMKLGEAIALQGCINGILATSDKVAGGIVFNLNKNLKAVLDHSEAFNDSRKKIVEGYAEKDKDGKIVYEELTKEDREAGIKSKLKFAEGEYEKANNEIMDLLQEEVKVELTQLPLSKFETLDFDTSKILGFDVFVDHMIDESK